MKHIALKPEDPSRTTGSASSIGRSPIVSNLEMRGTWRLAHPGKPLKDEDPMPIDVRPQYIKDNGQLIDEGHRQPQEGPRAAPRLRRRHGLPEPPAAAARLTKPRLRRGVRPLLKQADDLVEKAKEIAQN